MVLKVISLDENNRLPTQQEVFENMFGFDWKLKVEKMDFSDCCRGVRFIHINALKFDSFRIKEIGQIGTLFVFVLLHKYW